MQKVLLPAQPSTGASPSCTSPSSSTTTVTTPTATLSTNSQTDTSPSQPYIQPPLVSVQEVQATLGKMSCILIVTEKAPVSRYFVNPCMHELICFCLHDRPGKACQANTQTQTQMHADTDTDTMHTNTDTDARKHRHRCTQT